MSWRQLACGFTFVVNLTALQNIYENNMHLPKNYLEFSDAQAEVFCSLFWV